MKLSPDVIEKRLSQSPIARLATVSSEGQAHLVPVVFTWQAGKIWSPVDGKPKRGTPLKRVQNALVNPLGSLLLDEYDDDWSQLWWLRVDVKLEVIYLDEVNVKTQAEIQDVVTSLKQKYPQYKTTAVLTEHPTLLAMTPTNIRSWQAS